ncbi:MAG: KTSC domain-containing protein [Epsilonproteobacteria bacterium]|nr:KTSC domain-containing protein [Campylobacterota bacterium]
MKNIKKGKIRMETLTKVNSSMVYAVGYDYINKELEVVFNTGKIWIYKDVSQNVYEKLINSSSIGSFMINNIIDFYKEERIN